MGHFDVKKLRSSFSDNYDWLASIAAAIVVTFISIFGAYPRFIASATVFILGILSVGAFRDRESMKQLRELVAQLQEELAKFLEQNSLHHDGKKIGLSRVIADIATINWHEEIAQAKSLTLITALDMSIFDQRPKLFRTFEERLQAGSKLILLVPDPRAPKTILRYQEEPHLRGKGTVLEHSKEEVLTDIAKLIRLFSQWRTQIEPKKVRSTGRSISTNLTMLIGQGYPGYGYFKIDEKIYVIHYYHRKGDKQIPVFVYDDPNTEIYAYIQENLNEILKEAVSVDEGTHADICSKIDTHTFSDNRVRHMHVVVHDEGASSKNT